MRMPERWPSNTRCQPFFGTGERAAASLFGVQSGGAGFTRDHARLRRPTRTAARRWGKARGADAAVQLSTRFGTSFDGVRVHTGTASTALAKSIGARAFTVGSDVFFQTSEYRPETRAGKQLIAHELAHVVQQRGGVSAKRRRRAAAAGERSRARVEHER